MKRNSLVLATLALMLGLVAAQYPYQYPASEPDTTGLEGLMHLIMPVIAVAALAWVLLPLYIVWEHGDNPNWAMVGVLSSSSGLGVLLMLVYLSFMGMMFGSMYAYGYAGMSAISGLISTYGMIFLLETGLALVAWMMIPLILLKKISKKEP